MESEKVKEIKEKLQEEIFIANSFGDKLRKVPTKELEKILTLINELESENERLTKAVLDNLDAYRDGFTEGANLNNRVKNKWKEENQQLKDQIAELEKGKEETMKAWFEDREGMFWDGVREGELKGYKQLKQFAERLKAKAVQEGEYEDYVCYLIDRLLEEYGIKDK